MNGEFWLRRAVPNLFIQRYWRHIFIGIKAVTNQFFSSSRSAMRISPRSRVVMRQFCFPNGLRVWSAPRSGGETNFIFREIFEQRCYERHGIEIRNGDVVLDVGANVGLFALSVMERFRGLKILCFEPVPNTRAYLERNVRESQWRNDHEVEVLSAAIGSANTRATITYFPNAPGNSTLHLEAKRLEWNRIADELTPALIRKWNKAYALLPRKVIAFFMRPLLDDVVRFRCDVRTLSDIIRQRSLERIDLLKIDIEGAELDALDGIEQDHWPRIRQLVMEVSPANKSALATLCDHLRTIGFTKMTIENCDGGECFVRDALPCTLYAVRAPA
jgi:FkbM family methyltransferase